MLRGRGPPCRAVSRPYPRPKKEAPAGTDSRRAREREMSARYLWGQSDGEREMTEERTLEPGVHTGQPIEDYLRQPGASASRLRLLRRSPAHCRYAMEHPRPSTPAMLLGSATDAAILEPDTFAGRFIRGIDGDGRTKAVKEAREALAEEHPGAVILPPGDYDACLAMRDAVWAHPAARKLLQGDGLVQVSLAWEEDGDEDVVRCIGRPDRVTDSGFLVDLKTTADASPHGSFPRSMYEYGYVMQGVHYWSGLSRLGREIRAGLIIAVESSPPHAVVVYQPDTASGVAAESERDSLLRVWERCIRTDHWPAYPDTIQPISLPAWAVRQIEERVA